MQHQPEQVQDYVHKYPGYFSHTYGLCRIRLYRCEDGTYVAVCIQLESEGKFSITNAANWLPVHVIEDYLGGRGELLRWVEHYPKSQDGGLRGKRALGEWNIVTFESMVPVSDHYADGRQSLTNPRWQNIEIKHELDENLGVILSGDIFD